MEWTGNLNILWIRQPCGIFPRIYSDKLDVMVVGITVSLILFVWPGPGSRPSPTITTVCQWQVYLLLWFCLFGLNLVAGPHLQQ
jgi:hypothetical protein